MSAGGWDEMVLATWDAGRARWQGVDLPFDAFARHARAIAEDRRGTECPDLSAHGADAYLAAACLANDPRALDYLERQFLAQIPQLIAAIDRSPSFAAEVGQVVRERLLCPPLERLRHYAGAGPLAGWLRIVATRAALDMKRREGASLRRAHSLTAAIQGAARDPDWELLRKSYGSHLETALRAAVANLPLRDRTVLRLYLLSGVKVDAIARIYDVHRATIARWIVGAEQQIMDEVKRHFRDQLGIAGSECESLARGLKSRLDLCLESVL